MIAQQTSSMEFEHQQQQQVEQQLQQQQHMQQTISSQLHSNDSKKNTNEQQIDTVSFFTIFFKLFL